MFFKDARSMAEIKGTFFDRSPSAFDPVQGYRWLAPGFRVVRVINGEIVYDTFFRVNNYGCHSTYDYRPRKSSSRVFRFVVFGDSFTNDLALARAWPELLQDLLRSRPEHGRDIEVYGFPCDGGGLLNWYHTLKHLILPEFDFDAVIIADYFEDLGRRFTVCHSTEEGVYLGQYAYEDRPRDQADLDRLFPQMERLYDVTATEKIDDLVARLTSAAAPERIPAETYCQEWQRSAAVPPPDYVFSPEAFIRHYEIAGRWAMLGEMVAACQERGVPIIYSPMPTRQGVLRILKEGVTLLQQAEAAGIADHFGLDFFDGCGIFRGLDPQTVVDFHWLRHDGHWGGGGSGLYALRLAEWLVSRGLIPRHTRDRTGGS